MRAALVIVDVQYDFLPGGSLAVPGGERVIPRINAMLEWRGWSCVCATQDWHPPDHVSFKSNHAGDATAQEEVEVEWRGAVQRQTLWPDHCVQGTHGADIHDSLNQARIERVFRKGYHPARDSYSGFIDCFGYEETGLDAYLREKGIDTVYVVGVAEDFCVFHTALEAGRRGYETVIVSDAIAGIAALSTAQRGELEQNGVVYRDMAASKRSLCE